MGLGAVLDDLESRRAAGASDDDLAARFPDKFLRRVGHWGRPEGARAAFQKLAAGLDIAIVRLVPARQNDLAAASCDDSLRAEGLVPDDSEVELMDIRFGHSAETRETLPIRAVRAHHP